MHNSLAKNHIGTMSAETIANVRKFEKQLGDLPQVTIETTHHLHAGMYSRTIMVPAGVAIVGSLMKIPTLLILSGEHIMYVDDNPIRLSGYNVFTGNANRKQAGVSLTDTYITMVFPTNAKTIEEAEAEFTNETHLLFSRKEGAVNNIIVTGV